MNRHCVYFENIIRHNGVNYLFDSVRSCFMKLDFDDYTLTPIAITKVPSLFKEYPLSYGRIIKANNSLYAVPIISGPIVAYDLRDNTISYIDYEIDSSRNLGTVFSDAIRYDNQLVFIPCCYGRIVCLDLADNSIEYVGLEDYYYEKGNPSFAWKGYYVDGARIVFSIHTDNRIMAYDCCSKHIEVLKELPSNENLAGIVADDNYAWVIPMKADKIYKLHKHDLSICKTIDVFPDNYTCGTFSFNEIKLIGKHIYLLPRSANMALRLGVEDDYVEKVLDKPIPKTNGFYERFYCFSCVVENDDKVFLLETEEGIIHEFDSELKKEKEHKLLVDTKNNERICSDINIYEEDSIIGLSTFVRNIV